MPSLRRAAAGAALFCAALLLPLAAVAAPLGPMAAAAAQNKNAAAAPAKNAAAVPNNKNVAAAAAPPSMARKKKGPTPVPPIPTPDATGYVICEDQTYALCASASSWVYQQVAYAKCQIKQGDSISVPPLTYRTVGDNFNNICDVNAIGANNGFLASTFSLPEEVKAGGTKALYTCPGGSQGGYAQCDGGLCWRSTSGQLFPGVGAVGEDEIICSCPIVVADTVNAPFGWQFVGDWPCDQRAFSVCDQDPRIGDIIPVGAPPGAGRVLTELLYGQQYALNQCFPSQG
jgi:hypothetical protein